MTERTDIEKEKKMNVHFSLSLKFQSYIVKDLLQTDALLILGKGMGGLDIVSNLLHGLRQLNNDESSSKRPLIMLLNANDYENKIIEEELMELSWSCPEYDNMLPSFHSILGDSGTVDKRRAMYGSGGIISLSNRVLVTDLLGHVVEPDAITGLVVLHAENISQYSMDRFIINLYRSGNKWGFVKAVSSDAEKFCRGFQPLHTKLKYLKLEKSLLWPRFHIDVIDTIKKKLKNNINKVTEVRIKVTKYMEKIQHSLMASIEILIAELRRNNPDIATEYWIIENFLDKNFIPSIMGTLNPVWHRISATTKKLVSELTTLKVFLLDLFKLDSVTYYQNLMNFVNEYKQSMNTKESLWMLLPEASAVIQCSKDRLYRKINPSSAGSNKYDNILLEELPKWEQLLLILDDINENNKNSPEEEKDTGPTVIVCGSREVVYQLEKVLSKYRVIYNTSDNSKSYSLRKLMIDELKYQKWKRESRNLIIKMTKQLNEAKRDSSEQSDDIIISSTFNKNKVRNSDRRRRRGGSITAQHDRLMNLQPDGIDDEDVELLNDEVDENDYEQFEEDIEDSLWEESYKIDYELLERNSEVIITTFDSLKLNEMLPSNIICYEPSMLNIREIELFQISLNLKCKCFFIYYGESIEEQIYLNSLRFEKDSFTKLIREKANMPKFFSTEDDEVLKFKNDTVINTRIAGGGTLSLNDSNKIIIDMRDFNSQLPFVCHLSGLEIVPAMLTIGDYILTDEICVERKAVRDLIESLDNGRLMKQCENMFKYYAKPVLLIEFDEDKSFSFEPFMTGFLIGKGNTKFIKNSNLEKIQLKISILVKTYPKLSIIWSCSPFETAKIFKEIKNSRNNPDLEYSINAGGKSNSSKGFNEDAINFLKLIPGVNEFNISQIINKFENLYEFCTLSSESMNEVLGKDLGSKVFKFLNKAI